MECNTPEISHHSARIRSSTDSIRVPSLRPNPRPQVTNFAGRSGLTVPRHVVRRSCNQPETCRHPRPGYRFGCRPHRTRLHTWTSLNGRSAHGQRPPAADTLHSDAPRDQNRVRSRRAVQSITFLHQQVYRFQSTSGNSKHLLATPAHGLFRPLTTYLDQLGREFPRELFRSAEHRSSKFSATLHPPIERKENHATQLARLATNCNN